MDDPRQLTIVRRRHPLRWIAAGVVATFLAWLAFVLTTTEALQWDVVGEYLFSDEVLAGVRNTIVMTILCMAVGMVIGTAVAVMRLSPNPVLTGVAALYQWFFRGTPTLVQLIFWFNLSSIFPRFSVNVLGVQVVDVNTNEAMTPLVAAILGLGLNFGAYYSEVVRAGILSVDEGQSDCAAAYGLGRYQTLRHIVLPQAMRVIIPPTGNELIGMLKTTSLVAAVPYSLELYGRARDISGANFQPIPLLMVAATWYLAITSLLMIGQFYLERYYSKGASRKLTPRQLQALADAQGKPLVIEPGPETLPDTPGGERR